MQNKNIVQTNYQRRSFSARKKARKLNPTQKVIVRSRPLFVKKGDKVIFNFQHFVSPEKVVKEYIRVNIYNRNRLAKIDRKKISEALYSLQDVQHISDVESRDSKLKIHSKCENDEKRTSARRSKVKQNIIITENVRSKTKLTRPWQPVKRIPATCNIVYEFDPFGKGESDDASKGPKDTQNSLNPCTKGSTISKSTTNIRKDIARVKTRSSATLPKLNSNPDCTVNVLERQGKGVNLERGTSLPSIPQKRDTIKNDVILKESESRCKTTPSKSCEIDRDVENVKSSWKQFRKSHAPNPRSRKLYDMLEKATREIDKIQKGIDLTENSYSRKTAAKFPKDCEPSAESDVERIRNVLFPRRETWTNFKSTGTADLTSPHKTDLEEDILKKGKREMVKQRSLFTEKRLWNMDDVFDLESNILLNRNDKNERSNGINFEESSFLKERKPSKGKLGSVEKYLEDYIANSEKFDTVEQSEVRQREHLEPSPEYVADTLAKLNVNTVEIESDIEESNDDDLRYDSKDDEISKNVKKNVSTIDGTTSPCLSPIQNTEDSPKNVNKKPIETSDESNTKISGKDAIIKTGYNGLNLPKDVLDQVLQSEYLKKDLLSLYPI